MSNIDDEIRSKTEAFAADLTVLVRRVALESVSAVLGSTAAPVAVQGASKRGPGRPKKVAAPAPVTAAAKRGPGRPKKIATPTPSGKGAATKPLRS